MSYEGNCASQSVSSDFPVQWGLASDRGACRKLLLVTTLSRSKSGNGTQQLSAPRHRFSPPTVLLAISSGHHLFWTPVASLRMLSSRPHVTLCPGSSQLQMGYLSSTKGPWQWRRDSEEVGTVFQGEYPGRLSKHHGPGAGRTAIH